MRRGALNMICEILDCVHIQVRLRRIDNKKNAFNPRFYRGLSTFKSFGLCKLKMAILRFRPKTLNP